MYCFVFFLSRKPITPRAQGYALILLLLGQSRTNDIGIQLTVIAALLFLVDGLLLCLLYREREVLKVLNTEE